MRKQSGVADLIHFTPEQVVGLVKLFGKVKNEAVTPIGKITISATGMAYTLDHIEQLLFN